MRYTETDFEDYSFTKSIKRINTVTSAFLIGIVIVAILAVAGVFHATKVVAKTSVDIKISNNKSITQEELDAILDNHVSALSEMQATTLAVSAICVALGTLIIAVVTYFQSRKLELSRLEIDKASNSIHKYKEELDRIDEHVRTFTAIQSAFSLGNKDGQFYFDIISQREKELKLEKDRSARLMLLTINVSIAEQQGKRGIVEEYYKEIVEVVEDVVEGSSYAPFIIYYAYMEGINALYKLLRYSVQNNSGNSTQLIERANAYLAKAEKLNAEDSLGYHANMKGLIQYWAALSKGYTYVKTNPTELLKAIKLYDSALSKNEYKPEFLNHRAVVYLKCYEMYGGENYFKQAMVDLEKMHAISPNYFKYYLNHGNLLLKKLQKELGIASTPFLFKDLEDRIRKMHKKELLGTIVKLLTEADSDIIISTRLAPTYSNNHFKQSELWTYRLFLYKITHNKKLLNTFYRTFETAEELSEAIENQFSISETLDENIIGCMYCQRNFYELTNEIEAAISINEQIYLHNPTNADAWNELMKKSYSILT